MTEFGEFSEFSESGEFCEFSAFGEFSGFGEFPKSPACEAGVILLAPSVAARNAGLRQPIVSRFGGDAKNRTEDEKKY